MTYDKKSIMYEAYRRYRIDKEHNPGFPQVFSEYLEMVWFEDKYEKWFCETHSSDEYGKE